MHLTGRGAKRTLMKGDQDSANAFGILTSETASHSVKPGDSHLFLSAHRDAPQTLFTFITISTILHSFSSHNEYGTS